MGKMLLTIQHGKTIFSPPVMDEVKIEWERTGSPGKLTFTTVKTSGKTFTEGDAVCFYYDNKKVFMGYVFSKRLDKKRQIEVICYDQLRYLKNKYTYVFEKKTATQIIEALCKDYNLHLGTMEDTKYKIPAIAEENKAAFDIVLSTLEETLLNSGEQYVLYDDFGKLTLKNSANMVSDTLIFKDTAEDFEYKSSIDDETYNSIVLYYKPDKSGTKSTSATMDTTKIIQIAASQVGTAESPLGSDRQKYGEAYGYNGVAWCCIFVWWVFKEAGLSNLFYDGGRVAHCGTAMSWFKSQGRWVTSDPKPGDCVFFNWSGGSTADHIGIVESVKSNGDVVCIEGNCSNRVRRLARSSGIIGYGRPNYTIPSDTETASTFSARMATGGDETTTTTPDDTTTDAGEKIQVFTASDKDKINQWGTLRYFEKIETPAIGKSKAKALLKLYCRKTRELKVNGAFGDVSIRGGSLIPVRLDVGDKNVNNYMLVEKVTHNFSNDHHTMDLTLEGAWDD